MRRRYQRQKPRLSAAEINRWNDVARRVKRGEFDQRRVPQESPTEKPDRISGEWVWVENNSDRDFQRYEVGSLGPMTRTDADNAIVFTLAPENRYKPVCVFLEDTPKGEIGRAQVSGICRVAGVISQLEYRGYAYLDVNTNRIIRDVLDNQNHGNVRVLPNRMPGNSFFASPTWVVVAELNVEPTVAGDVLWEPINTSGNDWASLVSGKCSISGGGLSSSWWGWRIVEDPSATGAELIQFDRPGQYRFAIWVTPGQNTAVNPWEAIVEAYEVAGRVRWSSGPVSAGVGIYHWTFSGPQNTDGGYHAEAICNVHEVGTQVGLRGQCSGSPNQGAIANKLSIELLSPYHLPPETHDEQDTNPWNLNQQAL